MVELGTWKRVQSGEARENRQQTIHTYTHTYTHIYIYIHTYIHTYIHANTHTVGLSRVVRLGLTSMYQFVRISMSSERMALGTNSQFMHSITYRHIKSKFSKESIRKKGLIVESLNLYTVKGAKAHPCTLSYIHNSCICTMSTEMMFILLARMSMLP